METQKMTKVGELSRFDVKETKTEILEIAKKMIDDKLKSRKTEKKHMFFVDINIVANSKQEVIKKLGKRAYRFCSEIRDMGETKNDR